MRSDLDIEVCSLLKEAQVARKELKISEDLLELEEIEKEVLGGHDNVMTSTKGKLQRLLNRANIR